MLRRLSHPQMVQKNERLAFTIPIGDAVAVVIAFSFMLSLFLIGQRYNVTIYKPNKSTKYFQLFFSLNPIPLSIKHLGYENI
jgi:hypothetical protein